MRNIGIFRNGLQEKFPPKYINELKTDPLKTAPTGEKPDERQC